jgi:hypothetical protein
MGVNDYRQGKSGKERGTTVRYLVAFLTLGILNAA